MNLYLITQHALFNRLILGLLVFAFAVIPAQAQTADPHHATTKNVKQKKQRQHEAVEYSCPMHPEVKSKTPGTCPKCKMDLRVVEHEEQKPSEKAAAASASSSSKMNIPDIELLDQNGRNIHFYTDLVKGKTVAINFIFTTCTTICPPLGATFARVQKELAGRDVHFISITVDPATDTPERLKAWGSKFHAADSWTFVTGNKPQVDELLRALGASSARREDHSPTILIGNDALGIWTRTYGLANASQIVQLIDSAANGTFAKESK